MLRVALLEVAQPADELLARYVFVVGEEVALGGLAGVVDEDVGVGGHACYCADHVAVEGEQTQVSYSVDVWRERLVTDAENGRSYSFRI